MNLPHIGHKTMTHKFTNGNYIKVESRPSWCPGCTQERAAELKARMESKRYHIQYAQKLTCDKCGAHIGYAYDGDLNGSYFYCNNCKGSDIV